MANFKMGMKPKTRRRVGAFLTIFIGVTLAFLIWNLWKKLSGLLGDSWTLIGIMGVIVLIGLFFGFISIDKIIKKFS